MFQTKPFEKYYQANFNFSCESLTRSIFPFEVPLSLPTLGELSAALTAASDTDLVAALTDVPFEQRTQLLSAVTSCEEDKKVAASRSVVHVVGAMRDELQEYAAQQEQLTTQVNELAESVFNFKEQILQKEIHGLRQTNRELEKKSSELEVELLESHKMAQQLVEENKQKSSGLEVELLERHKVALQMVEEKKELFEMIGSLRKQIAESHEQTAESNEL
jgi:hypothetical protein